MKRIALLMLGMVSCYFSFSQAQETEDVLLPKADNRKINFGSSCVGTDLNRNFAYKWMVHLNI
jgi:hypothetical protein